MQPIVDELRLTFQDRAEFRSLNAALAEGRTAFRAYSLPGHPGYVILNPEGEVIWKGFGPQTAEELTSILDAGLDAGG